MPTKTNLNLLLLAFTGFQTPDRIHWEEEKERGKQEVCKQVSHVTFDCAIVCRLKIAARNRFRVRERKSERHRLEEQKGKNPLFHHPDARDKPLPSKTLCFHSFHQLPHQMFTWRIQRNDSAVPWNSWVVMTWTDVLQSHKAKLYNLPTILN